MEGGLLDNAMSSQPPEVQAAWERFVARHDQLREALAEVYFHLGPPQPRLSDHAQVPMLVQTAMAERDRLKAVTAEYEHALEHVQICTDACDACRRIAGSALAHENLADFTDNLT